MSRRIRGIVERIRHREFARNREPLVTSTRHGNSNQVWQVDYRTRTISDLHTIAYDDAEEGLLSPFQRKVIVEMIKCPRPFAEVAESLGSSMASVRETFRNAVRRHDIYTRRLRGDTRRYWVGW